MPGVKPPASAQGAKSRDKEQALKKLMSQADEIRHAILHADHERMADLTHPTVVEMVGGRADFEKHLDKMNKEMKAEGFRMTAIAFAPASELVEASGEVYAVIPFNLSMTGLGNKHGIQPSFLIGVSKDRGATWRFIDGNGVAGNRDKLKQVLPNFPDALPVPAKQHATWE